MFIFWNQWLSRGAYKIKTVTVWMMLRLTDIHIIVRWSLWQGEKKQTPGYFYSSSFFGVSEGQLKQPDLTASFVNR